MKPILKGFYFLIKVIPLSSNIKGYSLSVLMFSHICLYYLFTLMEKKFFKLDLSQKAEKKYKKIHIIYYYCKAKCKEKLELKARVKKYVISCVIFVVKS